MCYTQTQKRTGKYNQLNVKLQVKIFFTFQIIVFSEYFSPLNKFIIANETNMFWWNLPCCNLADRRGTSKLGTRSLSKKYFRSGYFKKYIYAYRHFGDEKLLS